MNEESKGSSWSVRPLMGRQELEKENEKLRALVLYYADQAGFTARHVIATLKEEGIRPPKRVRKKKGE